MSRTDFRSTNSLDLSAEERFWMKVVRPEDPAACWVWVGAKDGTGYGRLNLPSLSRSAHRAVFALLGKPVPKGVVVCHRCDNPACVNPDHLFLGSMADNQADMARKNRSAHGSKSPHAKLTEADVRRVIAMREAGLQHGEIATAVGVHRVTVTDILSGRTWRRVTEFL